MSDFNPSRVPVSLWPTGDRSTSDLPLARVAVDLRPFAAWLVQEIGTAIKVGVPLSVVLASLSDKIAAGVDAAVGNEAVPSASAETVGKRAPPSAAMQGSVSGPAPATEAEAEIGTVIRWLREIATSKDSVLNVAADIIERQAKELAEAQEDIASATRRLTDLFLAIAPQCEPFAELRHVISQIDNAIVGLRERATTAEAKLKAANAALRRAADDLTIGYWPPLHQAAIRAAREAENG